MKKVKLLALMLAASISLTACGTDGGTEKAGVFAGVKTADRISTNKYYTIDKVRVREIANLVNEMDYEEIEGGIPDVFFEDSNEDIEEDNSFDTFVCSYEVSLGFSTSVKDYMGDKRLCYVNGQYCTDWTRGKNYKISSSDENTYEKLKQMYLKLEGIGILDYEKMIKEGGSSDAVMADKVQLDTENPNYAEWAKGICCDIASVPDRGEVTLFNNNYMGFECAYKIDNVTKDDFIYLVDKYKKEGFNQDVSEYDCGFMAYSDKAAFDYMAIDYREDCIVLTVGGDINRAGSVTGGWEDGKLGKYAPKPENGDCYIMRDRADYYPAPGENVHSEYVVYNVDEEQAGEYIELCKRNGYTDDEDYNDITDDDNQVYWAGVTEDCRIFVKQGKDDTFMTVTLYLLQKDDSDAVN
mgnify:FL=1